MIIDAHVHFGIPTRPAFGNAAAYTSEDLLRNMDRAEIDMSLIMGIPHVYDNDYIIEQWKQHEDRFIPWAYIDPWRHAKPEQSIRELAEQGFRGIKLRAVGLRFHLSDHVLLDPILHACRENGLIVSMHTGDDAACTPFQLKEMAVAFPDLQFVLIHGGFRMLIEDAIQVAKDCPNVIIDQTAGSSWQLRRALDELGAERILYGSDSPFMDTRVELKRFRVAIQDPTELALAIGGNAQRLYGIGARS